MEVADPACIFDAAQQVVDELQMGVGGLDGEAPSGPPACPPRRVRTHGRDSRRGGGALRHTPPLGTILGRGVGAEPGSAAGVKRDPGGDHPQQGLPRIWPCQA